MNSIESSFAEKKLKGISISFFACIKKTLSKILQAIMLFEEKKYCCCSKKKFRYSF